MYLNDFDWYVGRQYCEPHRTCKQKNNDIARLRNQDKNQKYNFRYADDWIILTSKRYEAERMKKELTKYFRHKLKFELSEEKTKITDIRKDGAEFLGFVIRAEKPRLSGKDSEKLAGKPFLNMVKLSTKITRVCDEIHAMKHMKHISDRVAQIQYINSMIMGIVEYIKIGICSKAIDHRMYVSCHYTWKRLYPGEVMRMKVPLCRLSNIPHRHEGYRSKTHAIKHQKMWRGITRASLTHSQHEKYPLNQKTSLYTAEGRKLYLRQRKYDKPLPLNRPSVNTDDDLRMSAYAKSIYNFEYFMNREYAFNRDNRWGRFKELPITTKCLRWYTYNADTIAGNCDTTLFLGGKEKRPSKKYRKFWERKQSTVSTPQRTEGGKFPTDLIIKNWERNCYT